MALIVQKYGGSSVGTIDRIRNVARRLIETKNAGHQVMAVISAMSGVTDKLIGLAKQVLDSMESIHSAQPLQYATDSKQFT